MWASFCPTFAAANERFNFLTQVAGRAGRSHHGGRVVVQTYSPDHYAIQAAAQHDYVAFYKREMHFRHEHNYPPVRRLARSDLLGSEVGQGRIGIRKDGVDSSHTEPARWGWWARLSAFSARLRPFSPVIAVIIDGRF